MNSSKWISFTVIGLFSLFLIFGLPGMNREWFQFPRNVNINDNSRNWANHEYGYNLMMSAEPNSIFMTEGGDNQVFSLLYFATAERMRPDIDFFDQKGNVFPRLYGDLLNTHPDEIELIRDIRDFQIFSTERPIYLTWQRDDLEKLNINTIRQRKKKLLSKFSPDQQSYYNNKYRLDTLDQLKATARSMVPNSVYTLELRSGGNLAEQDFRYLGPWYFKNFGMVFRVTPLRYAIIDALEALNGKGDFSTINTEVAALSKFTLIPEQYQYYVGQLTKEGYVRQEGNDLVMIKPFRGTFEEIDPIEQWDKYRFSYLEVSNAGKWDFLTREIFGNNIRTLSSSVSRKINTLQKQYTLTTNPAIHASIQDEINHWINKLEKFRSTIPLYNYDNPGMTYNYAIDLERKGSMPKAAELFALTAQANYRFSEYYLKAASIILSQAEKNDENHQRYINQAKDYLRNFYQSQKIMIGMTGTVSPNQEKNSALAESLEKRIAGMKTAPSQKIEKLSEEAGDDITKLTQLAALHRDRGEKSQAIEMMTKIINLQPQNYQNYYSLYDYTKDTRPDAALSAIEKAIQNYQNITGEKPPLWELYYYKGSVIFNMSSAAIKQSPDQKELIKNQLQQSQSSLYEFLNGFSSVKDTAESDLKQKGMIAEKTLKRIEELLAQYR